MNKIIDQLLQGAISLDEAVSLLEAPHIPMEGSTCPQGHKLKSVDLFVERSPISKEDRIQWFSRKDEVISYCIEGDHFVVFNHKTGESRPLTSEESEYEEDLRIGFINAAKAGREIYALNYSELSKERFPDNERMNP